MIVLDVEESTGQDDVHPVYRHRFLYEFGNDVVPLGKTPRSQGHGVDLVDDQERVAAVRRHSQRCDRRD